MLKNRVEEKVLKNLGFEPTPGQKTASEKLAEFILYSGNDRVFILKGFAGTGKTSLISALIKSLPDFKIKSVLLAPTGRAAKVLSSYSGMNAYTIHKKIYRQKSSRDAFGVFTIDRNLHKNTLFIVDEASMIGNTSFEQSNFGSGNLLNDLLEYVYSGANCKLILAGDTAQLPPVGTDLSPALNAVTFENEGFGCETCLLSDVVRQQENSGVLANATLIRQNIDNQCNELKIHLENYTDIRSISGIELLEELENSYGTSGIEQTIIVTRSNKRANQYNQGIRNRVLYRDEEISAGDLMMVVKNNYFWSKEFEQIDFIANGDIIEIQQVRKYHDLYGFRFADVVVRLPDYDSPASEVRILLDTLHSETASLSQSENRKLWDAVAEDYAEVSPKALMYKQIKEDPFFNALQVKFAYALTCHKSQGGQWKTVFVDQGYLKPELIDREYLRWFYTAFTRTTEKMFLVNFSPEFIEE